jgi:hypothetical protein
MSEGHGEWTGCTERLAGLQNRTSGRRSQSQERLLDDRMRVSPLALAAGSSCSS